MKNYILGYARVSMEQQNLDRQLDALQKYGVGVRCSPSFYRYRSSVRVWYNFISPATQAGSEFSLPQMPPLRYVIITSTL